MANCTSVFYTSDTTVAYKCELLEGHQGTHKQFEDGGAPPLAEWLVPDANARRPLMLGMAICGAMCFLHPSSGEALRCVCTLPGQIRHERHMCLRQSWAHAPGAFSRDAAASAATHRDAEESEEEDNARALTK